MEFFQNFWVLWNLTLFFSAHFFYEKKHKTFERDPEFITFQQNSRWNLQSVRFPTYINIVKIVFFLQNCINNFFFSVFPEFFEFFIKRSWSPLPKKIASPVEDAVRLPTFWTDLWGGSVRRSAQPSQKKLSHHNRCFYFWRRGTGFSPEFSNLGPTLRNVQE